MLGDTSWLSCDFIAQVFLGYKSNMADDEIIVFLLSVISSLITCLELNIALLTCMREINGLRSFVVACEIQQQFHLVIRPWKVYSVLFFSSAVLFLRLDMLGKLKKIIGSLTSDVFERRTSAGSEVFSLLTCLDDIKFIFLSFFTVIEAIWLKICAKPPSKNEERPLPVDVRRSKTLLLKLPNFANPTISEPGTGYCLM